MSAVGFGFFLGMGETAMENPAQCGILLHPVGHTRSPAMHTAAFAALGIHAVYRAFDVPPDALEAALDRARRDGMRQLAISIPHKETVMTHLDEVDAVARRIGAVNTVTLREGRLLGANTDWLGAVQALERETMLRDRSAVVLGAGGAARGITYGLIERGARVTILNRTPARADALCKDLGAQAAGKLSDLGDLDFDILVNATSVGLGSDLSPIEANWIPSGVTVMDSVYEPPTTRLLRDAEARGARPIGGKWMLVYQAGEQLRIWTEREPPIDVMARAFDQAGGENA